MSIKIGKVKEIPDWLDIEWNTKERLKSIQNIMNFSSRDWSSHDVTEKPKADPETWAIYCLANSETKDSALHLWWTFCKNNH